MKTPTIEQIRELAVHAHGAQKYGEDPYSVHLDAVVSVLGEFGFDSFEDKAVGLLHDTIEDTSLTSEKLIEVGIPVVVVHGVLFCTDERGINRKARKRLTYARVKSVIAACGVHDSASTTIGVRTKLADRIVNIKKCKENNPGLLEMYKSEHQDFCSTYYMPGTNYAIWEYCSKMFD